MNSARFKYKRLLIISLLFVGAFLLYRTLWQRVDGGVVNDAFIPQQQTVVDDAVPRAETPSSPFKDRKTPSVVDVEELDYFARARDALKLIMISRDPYDPSDSRATLQDMEFRKRRVVHLHEEIPDYPGVRIEDIQLDEVIIESEDGRTASLELLEKAPGPSEEEVFARLLEDQRPTVYTYEDVADFQRSRRTQEGFLSSAQVSPALNSEGEMIGVKLYVIYPNSIYDQLGLTPNDVLVEVNSVRASSNQETELMLDQLVSSDYLELVILKADGSRQVREVYLSETPNG
jgi:type II secretory pathway component PulC